MNLHSLIERKLSQILQASFVQNIKQRNDWKDNQQLQSSNREVGSWGCLQPVQNAVLYFCCVFAKFLLVSPYFDEHNEVGKKRTKK